MEQELKPCPFCGGPATSGIGQMQDGSPWHYIECMKCAGMADGMEAWNNRPLEDALKAKLAELTAERESLSQDRNHWAFEARLMAEKVKPLEDERDALKAKLAEAARLAESTRECVGEVVDGSEAARLRDKLAKVQAWRDEMLPDCCSCSDRYSKRSLIDPSCHWHDLDVPDLDAILNDAREGGEG